MRGIDEEDDEDDDNSLDREFGGDFPEEAIPSPPMGTTTASTTTVRRALCRPSPDQERALREKFEQTLAEYDSDDVGDLDDECEDIRGDREFEGDAQLEAAFDDFLQEKKDEIFIEGTRHLPENKRVGGSGYAALVNGKMVRGRRWPMLSATPTATPRKPRRRRPPRFRRSLPRPSRYWPTPRWSQLRSRMC